MVFVTLFRFPSVAANFISIVYYIYKSTRLSLWYYLCAVPHLLDFQSLLTYFFTYAPCRTHWTSNHC